MMKATDQQADLMKSPRLVPECLAQRIKTIDCDQRFAASEFARKKQDDV